MARLVGILLAAVVLAACGPAVGAPTGPPSSPTTTPRPSDPTTPPLTAPPVATAAPPTRQPATTVTFEGVLDIEQAELFDIAAFDGGYVAGGCRHHPPGQGETPCASALLLISADGRSWTEVAPPGAVDRQVVALSTTPLGVFAFATTLESEPPRHRALWRLVDGERWESFEMPAPSTIVFEDALTLGDATVFIGSDQAYDLSVQTEAWVTTDGATWTHGTTPLGPKVAVALGIVAFGDACVDLCPPNVEPRTFRSTDALAWTEEPIPTEMRGNLVNLLGAVDGQAIVGGASGGMAPAADLWFDDLGGWRHVVLEDGSGAVVTHILDAPRGVVAIGREVDDGPWVAWWSEDRVTWTPSRLEGLGGGWIVADATGDDLVVIVDYVSIWLATF